MPPWKAVIHANACAHQHRRAWSWVSGVRSVCFFYKKGIYWATTVSQEHLSLTLGRKKSHNHPVHLPNQAGNPAQRLFLRDPSRGGSLFLKTAFPSTKHSCIHYEHAAQILSDPRQAPPPPPTPPEMAIHAISVYMKQGHFMRTKGARSVRKAGKQPSFHRKRGEILKGAASQESHREQSCVPLELLDIPDN